MLQAKGAVTIATCVRSALVLLQNASKLKFYHQYKDQSQAVCIIFMLVYFHCGMSS